MELYLNNIYLGHSCYGVKTAAQTYFGKDVSELTIAECADDRHYKQSFALRPL